MKIHVIVSVDWEGRDLENENERVFKDFREKYPEVPMQQFLNAAYLTKNVWTSQQVRAFHENTLRDIDELGLHIHPWKSLVEASGVEFQSKPRLFDDDTDLRESHGDVGHEVALFAYDKMEVTRMIKKSENLLSSIGLKLGNTFRSGAWLASNDMHEALVECGYKMDCSAVDGDFLSERWGDYQLCKWVKELWPQCERTSQPYLIDVGGKSLLEVPNNGCLADYVDELHMLETLKQNFEAARKNRLDKSYVSIGFHQETAKKFLHRLDKAIPLMKDYAKKQNFELTFINKVET